MKQPGLRAVLATSMLGAAMAIASLPGVTLAKDGDIIRTGSCTGGADWKLKLSPEDGKIEVEFEVDQNQNGQTWNVRLKRDGNLVWKGQRTTHAPSGSFEVRRVISDESGADHIKARARHPASGQVCRGSATFGI
jgi:hypothetical protein